MNLKNYLKIIIPIGLLYSFFHFIGIGCPIKFVTGIPCAGCGMTRAWFQVLHLNLLKAYYYHPLFWSIPFLILFLLLKNKGILSKKISSIIIFCIVMIFSIVYMYRLLDPNDTIVKINLSDSVFMHCFRILAERRK